MGLISGKECCHIGTQVYLGKLELDRLGGVVGVDDL